MMNAQVDETRESRLRALTAAFIVVFVVTLGLGFTGILYTVVAVRDTQVERASADAATKSAAQDAARAAEDAARIAVRIEDCTTPGRQCFDDGQNRTDKAVQGINERTLAVIVAAISCQNDGITDQESLARCTVKRASAK